MPITNVDSALTTLAAFKVYRELTDTSKDTLISSLIPRASARISSFCNRKFTQATYSETFNGNGTHLLYVTHWPITTPLSSAQNGVGNVWEHQGGVFNSSSLLVERSTTSGAGHYVVHPGEDGQGLIEKYGYFGGGDDQRTAWPRGTLNIKVTYQGGYATIPDEIAQAAIRLTAVYFLRAERGLDYTTSESIQAGGGSMSAIPQELPKDIIEMLTPWKAARLSGVSGL